MSKHKTMDWDAPRLQTAIVLVLIVFFLVFGVLSVRDKTQTTDEGYHLLYGTNILSGNSTRFDDSKMPISAFNALPGKIGSLLPTGALSIRLGKLLTARMMTILFSALVALLVFYWSRSLYGFIPALFSLILYILDPNIIAHSQLVTTDIYAAGTITFSFYCLWRFAHHRDWRNGLLYAFSLGLSQIAKYTAVALYPLFILVLLAYDAAPFLRAYKENAAEAIKGYLKKYLLYGVTAIVISILIINIGFLFNRTFTHFGEYKFRSGLFQSIQLKLPILRNVPVPVPYPYVEGLDWVIERERTGDGYGRIYLLGQTRESQGFMGYYFVASLLKEPIASQILVLAAIGVYIFTRARYRRFVPDELFLIAPVVFYTIYFNFFYNAQIGIRYYLVVYPLLYVFTGSLFTGWKSFRPIQKAASLALLAYLAISVFSYYPYYIPYFNEIVWNRTDAYKYLADSNLDWGQNKNVFNQYMADHPDAYRPSGIPKPGLLVVRVNSLVGVLGYDPQSYAWLRNNFEPVRTLAYSYLVYEITPAEIANLCATTSDCNK